MNRLALGTVQFGVPYGIANHSGQVSRAEANAMLQHALANGIDTLDTAIAYGDSESCLGKVGTKKQMFLSHVVQFKNGLVMFEITDRTRDNIKHEAWL